MRKDEELRYKPVPLTDLLSQLKNLSQILMSLAYCSIFFNDDTLYKEMMELDDKIDYLKSLMIMQASLAIRGGEDAERMLSVFDMAASVDKISEVSLDIAKLAYENLSIDIGDYLFINSATNFIYVIEIDLNSPFKGKTIREAFDLVKQIFDVVAVKRERSFIISPSEDYTFVLGDKVYIKGFTETIRNILKLHRIEIDIGGLKLNREILENIIYLKNLSEFMIDIAYGALFTSSKELANELLSMEEAVDEITEQLKIDVMKDKDLIDTQKLALIEFINYCEYLADAAIDMTYSLRKDVKPHPIIEKILEETDERYAILKIGGEYEDMDIVDLGVKDFGIDVLALKREGYWYLNPPIKGWKLREGDEIIIQFYREADKEVEKILGRKR
ncbi:TPA: hypothetical protein EYP83_02580 [Candidatus Geothermarchaeota archaeon]|nr:hypothetical protein [Candidatus Geothermarchaeota archaeon]